MHTSVTTIRFRPISPSVRPEGLDFNRGGEAVIFEGSQGLGEVLPE